MHDNANDEQKQRLTKKGKEQTKQSVITLMLMKRNS